MNLWIFFILAISMGYLLGSLPIGYWVGKYNGVDLLASGSGSTGTTNALRIMGKGPAVLVFCGDFLKGLVAPLLIALLSANLITNNESSYCANGNFVSLAQALCGIGAVIGHAKSIWIGFRGGKSVATGAGVLIALDWRVGLLGVFIWIAMVAITKISSLGGLSAATIAPFAAILLNLQPLQAISWCVKVQALGIVGFSSLASIYIIYKHRTNITRILNRTEPRIGEKKPQ